jgi:hypothetical protein
MTRVHALRAEIALLDSHGKAEEEGKSMHVTGDFVSTASDLEDRADLDNNIAYATITRMLHVCTPRQF